MPARFRAKRPTPPLRAVFFSNKSASAAAAAPVPTPPSRRGSRTDCVLNSHQPTTMSDAPPSDGGACAPIRITESDDVEDLVRHGRTGRCHHRSRGGGRGRWRCRGDTLRRRRRARRHRCARRPDSRGRRRQPVVDGCRLTLQRVRRRLVERDRERGRAADRHDGDVEHAARDERRYVERHATNLPSEEMRPGVHGSPNFGRVLPVARWGDGRLSQVVDVAHACIGAASDVSTLPQPRA